MAGIYIHIPFCKQACTYCDFHFSTSGSQIHAMVDAMTKEISLQKDFFNGEKIRSIYFGGGTPSLLPTILIEKILDSININFQLEVEEITIEGNPDDLTLEKLKSLLSIGFNRLSVGIQSFLDADLKWMNRAHTASDAISCLDNIEIAGFKNYSVDLIYGLPYQTKIDWKKNIEILKSYKPPHISSYALTIEPKTILSHQIEKKILTIPDEAEVESQYFILCDLLNEAEYDHYEISNFARNKMYAKHNSSYWNGDQYLGIGPSAHSFNSATRCWNIANNALYIQSIENETLPNEFEVLSDTMKLNEYLMVSLRTKFGVDENYLKNITSDKQFSTFQFEKDKYLKKNFIFQIDHKIIINPKNWFIADKIISDLFFEEM